MSSFKNETNSDSNKEEENIYDSSYEINSWDELDIDSSILRGIYAYGFENPSHIQKKAIRPIIAGKDIIAQAQSGTGKTATFAISSLSLINLKDNSTQVLILSPTRELTTQTASVFSKIGCMIPELRLQVLFGGSLIEEGSIFSNKNIPHVICGCAGRVFDMLRRDKINAKNNIIDINDFLFKLTFDFSSIIDLFLIIFLT